MKPTHQIRIVAAIVDVHNLTLYKETGETIIIPQGDPRVRRILQEATPQLLDSGSAMVDIGTAEENQYAKFEKESNGVVQFFRVAKAKIKHLFIDEPEAVVENTKPVPPLSIGVPPAPVAAMQAAAIMPEPLGTVMLNLPDLELPQDPVPTPPVTMADVHAQLISDAADAIEQFGEDELERFAEEQRGKGTEQTSKVKHTMAAVDEILKHAIPASAAEFSEDNVAKQGNVVEEDGRTDNQKEQRDDETHTIIAVVDGKVIPGMEKIKTQFTRAAKLGSTLGVENFLRRLAAVIEKRSHSIEDLLKFMERGDLPIADDGSILIYKVLSRKGSKTDGKFVDCHTRNVEQWTGAYVCMDESLVDHNRSTECSNGLHVARRGYIRGFSGDVCVLAKLAPEDVIAVPAYDANKMRVCGYHILMELSDVQFKLLKNNNPITDDAEGKTLLANALAGRHIHKTHEVRITGQRGTGVTVKKLTADVFTKSKKDTPEIKFDEPAKVEAEAIGNPDKEQTDTPVDVLDVVKTVNAMSVKGRAEAIHAEVVAGVPGAVEKLLRFKKASKKSWTTLGIPDPTLKGLPVPAVTPPMPAVAEPLKIDGGKSPRDRVTKKLAAAKQVANVKPEVFSAPSPRVVKNIKASTDKRVVNDVQLGEGSPRERITKLLAIGLTSVGVAGAILTLKKRSKKSWEYLGVSKETVKEIIRIAGHG
jgi:hypothetical protein